MPHEASPGRALPRRLPLTARTWRAAAVIAGLRLASNDMTRTARRDQGAAGNVRNDIMGVLAKLVGRYALETGPAAGPVTGVLLDPDGAVDDVDASFTDADGRVHRVEIKGHLRQDSYWRFAINDEAHRRSAARGATGYVGVLTTMGGPRAVVSRVLPLAEVEGWDVELLNPSRHDPARVLPLARFRALFTDGDDVDPATHPVVGGDELQEIVAIARAHLQDVRAEAPPALAGTAAAARDWAQAALLRWR